MAGDLMYLLSYTHTHSYSKDNTPYFTYIHKNKYKDIKGNNEWYRKYDPQKHKLHTLLKYTFFSL